METSCKITSLFVEQMWESDPVRLYRHVLKSTLPDIPKAIQHPERYISHEPSCGTGQGDAKKFFIPYNLPEYINRNGMHPLICEYFPFIREADWNIKTYGEDKPEFFPELDLDLGFGLFGLS